MVLQGLCYAVLLVLHGFVGDAFRAVFHGLFRLYKHVYIASNLAFGCSKGFGSSPRDDYSLLGSVYRSQKANM